MAEEKWYRKTSVQAAMVAGIFTCGAAIVGVVFKGQPPSEPAKTTIPQPAPVPPTGATGTTVPKPAPVPPTGATGAQNHDRAFSAESTAARQALRGTLRNTSAAESSVKIAHIPPGTFGFSHPHLFRYADFDVDRIPNGRLSFEIHKLASKEVYALAFVNADTQRQIQLDSKVKAPVTLYSDMWPDAPYAVRVDITSCRGDSRLVRLDGGGTVIAVDCVPVRLK